MSTNSSKPEAASRRGPRADSGAARQQILQASRQVLAESGFATASLQKIADRAGVNKKLIHYYFGSKDDLFLAVFNELFEQLGFAQELVKPVWGRHFDGVAYVTKILETIEHSDVAPGLLALMRSFGTHDPSRRLFTKFIEEGVLTPLAKIASQATTEDIGTVGDSSMPTGSENAGSLQRRGEDARLRVVLAGSQINGMIMVRYILRIEPLASLTIPEAAKLFGPTIENYLTGSGR